MLAREAGLPEPVVQMATPAVSVARSCLGICADTIAPAPATPRPAVPSLRNSTAADVQPM